jgi:hypothetical protein
MKERKKERKIARKKERRKERKLDYKPGLSCVSASNGPIKLM